MQVLKTIEQLREKIHTEIKSYDSCALLTHQNPDGDGLSVCLVLKELFLTEGKEVPIVIEDDPPENLELLDAKKRCVRYNDGMSFQLLIVVDCHSLKRLGECKNLVASAESVIVIDHHEEDNPIANSSFYNDPQAVSTGLIIFELFYRQIKALNSEQKKRIAEALYVTILNDTNNFTNNNTDERTFKFAADLVALGLNPADVTRRFLATRPPEYYRFLGQALATIETYESNKILFFHSTLKMLEENNLTENDTSKLTDWVKNSENCEVIVYFREISEKRYRLSLRSKTINVNSIAAQYGGGGHLLASGCVIEGDLIAVKRPVLENLIKLV